MFLEFVHVNALINRRPSRAWLFSVLGTKSTSPFLLSLRTSTILCWTHCTGCEIPAAEPQYVGKNPALKVEELQEVQLPLVLCDSFLGSRSRLWVHWANVGVVKLAQMEKCLTLLAQKNKMCFFVSLVSSKLRVTNGSKSFCVYSSPYKKKPSKRIFPPLAHNFLTAVFLTVIVFKPVCAGATRW